MGSCVPVFLIRSSVCDPWLDFHACEKAAGNFFISPLGSTARSRRRVGRRFIVRQAQRLRRLGRAAAARSTGLRPVHFIHFIEAAINRGPNLPEGIHNHYNSVMIGKKKVFGGKLRFALRVGRSKSPRGL